MGLSRKLAAVLLAAAALSTGSAAALSGYDDGFRSTKDQATLDVGVNFISARTADVKVVITDKPGDAYCTVALADLNDRNGNTIGNVITLGSVCGGKTAALPLKRITTSRADYNRVDVWATKGTGGTPTNIYEQCYRGTDSYFGRADVCR